MIKPMFLATALVMAASAAWADDYVESVERWHAERVERLTQPHGWLSLVGLHWVEPGQHTLGSAADNAIVLGAGPARLGTLTADPGGAVSLSLADGVDARIGDGDARSARLVTDAEGIPTQVRFGDALFTAIVRSGRLALRVRDANAPSRTGFTGIERYPVSANWRIEGRFVAHEPPRTLEIATVLGTIDPMANPGKVEFEYDGRPYSLEALDQGDGQLFFVFADRTSGKETYGMGRFLYADPAVDGKVVLDFNKAYNPPCAFTSFSTCPFPPEGNRLDTRVEAGEKKYKGPTG